MMTIGRNKQRGEFNFGTLLFILLLVMTGVVLMKLSGPFMDDMAVAKSLQGLAEEKASTTLSPRQIRDAINKRLRVNSVEPLADHEILIRKEDGNLLVDISYERRVKMYSNVDAVMKFDHSASLK